MVNKCLEFTLLKLPHKGPQELPIGNFDTFILIHTPNNLSPRIKFCEWLITTKDLAIELLNIKGKHPSTNASNLDEMNT